MLVAILMVFIPKEVHTCCARSKYCVPRELKVKIRQCSCFTHETKLTLSLFYAMQPEVLRSHVTGETLQVLMQFKDFLGGNMCVYA